MVFVATSACVQFNLATNQCCNQKVALVQPCGGPTFLWRFKQAYFVNQRRSTENMAQFSLVGTGIMAIIYQ